MSSSLGVATPRSGNANVAEGAGTNAASSRSGPVAGSTLTAYANDVRRFRRWQLVHDPRAAAGVSPEISVTEVIDYLAFQSIRTAADGSWLLSAASARRWVSAIDHDQAEKGFERPGLAQPVRQILKGLSQERTRHKPYLAPIPLGSLREAVRRCFPCSEPILPIAVRDSALLLVAWVSALGVSDALALRFGDLRSHPDGLTLHVSSFGTDVQVPGALRLLPRGERLSSCVVCALIRLHRVAAAAALDPRSRAQRLAVLQFDHHICDQEWLHEVDPARPLFSAFGRNGLPNGRQMSTTQAASVVKVRLKTAGLGGANMAFGSLRLGFIASAIEAGQPFFAILKQTGALEEGTFDRLQLQYGPSPSNAS